MISTTTRRAAVAAMAIAALVVGVMASPVAAGRAWEGQVDAGSDCIDGEGVVLVDIFDDFSADYDVLLFLGEDLVDSALDITDTDEGENTVVFGPLDDGIYTVQVEWLNEELQVFDGEVTVACVPDETTTTTTTTVSPSSTSTAPAAAAAASATPRFTG